jgi:photosystem II stability/assembly factor-like uncharacterized protein
MRYFNGWLVALVIIFISTGCEAPLQMDAVEQGLNTPVRRSDQFQMASANDSTIVVVGNQALVLTSTDQGGTWRRSQLTGWPELIDVTSCPNGYFAALAAEGEVWVSQDDGNEWVSHAIDSEEAPQAITCDSRDRIWVVGSFSSIFSSEDAGASWDFTSLDEDTILTNIQFVDEQTAYISGEFGTLLRTTDGGETWERLPDLEDNFYPQAMYFEDTSMGWVVGLQGQILHTEDRGESWVMQQSGTLAPLFGIEAIGGELYAVGGEGTVLRQRGKQWSSVDHGKPVTGYLRALLPVGADRLLVAGQAGALHVLPLGGS